MTKNHAPSPYDKNLDYGELRFRMSTSYPTSALESLQDIRYEAICRRDGGALKEIVEGDIVQYYECPKCRSQIAFVDMQALELRAITDYRAWLKKCFF